MASMLKLIGYELERASTRATLLLIVIVLPVVLDLSTEVSDPYHLDTIRAVIRTNFCRYRAIKKLLAENALPREILCTNCESWAHSSRERWSVFEIIGDMAERLRPSSSSIHVVREWLLKVACARRSATLIVWTSAVTPANDTSTPTHSCFRNVQKMIYETSRGRTTVSGKTSYHVALRICQRMQHVQESEFA
jgi:hypothetical protein